MSDNTEVLAAITKLTQTVEQYHGDFREFRGETTQKMIAFESRVSDIEQTAKDDLKATRLWGNIKVICVLPVVGVLHQVASHFGWIK